MSVITPKNCFHQPQVADLRLIACPAEEADALGKRFMKEITDLL